MPLPIRKKELERRDKEREIESRFQRWLDQHRVALNEVYVCYEKDEADDMMRILFVKRLLRA